MIQTIKSTVNCVVATNSQTLTFKTATFLAVAIGVGVFASSAEAQFGSLPTGNQAPGNQFTKNRATRIETLRNQSLGSPAVRNPGLGSPSINNPSLGNQSSGNRFLQNQFSDNGRFGSHTGGLNLLKERPSEEESDPVENISVARDRVKMAKKELVKVEELSRLGSVSQTELRSAELTKWLAVLELSDLMSPDSKAENSRLRAQLILNYRVEELAVIKRLYERGSASELKYRRAITARDVAAAKLELVRSDSDTQRKFHAMTAANSKYKEALSEHQMAGKLFASGSINQTAMEQVSRNLEAAKSELVEAKKLLKTEADKE